MLEKIFTQEVLVALIILILFLITVYFANFTIRRSSYNKYEKVIFPTYESEESKALNSKKMSFKKDKNHKEKLSLKERFYKLLSTGNLDKKIKRLYERGGKYNKTIEDFVQSILKFFFFSIVIVLCGIYLIGNVIVPIVVGLVILALPIIDLFGDIQDRQNEFRRDFPYFLQTLSFVLSNGSNMSIAFGEVTNKQGEGVLKEVMLDVISTERVNGGDFTKAFSSIVQKIDIDETREFVEIVQNNLEKGVPVADTFSSQSETISRFISNRQKRKIKSISTKILLPILLALIAIAIFFL